MHFFDVTAIELCCHETHAGAIYFIFAPGVLTFFPTRQIFLPRSCLPAWWCKQNRSRDCRSSPNHPDPEGFLLRSSQPHFEKHGQASRTFFLVGASNRALTVRVPRAV